MAAGFELDLVRRGAQRGVDLVGAVEAFHAQRPFVLVEQPQLVRVADQRHVQPVGVASDQAGTRCGRPNEKCQSFP